MSALSTMPPPFRTDAMSPAREMPDIFWVLKRHRLLVALGAILGALVGYGLFKFVDPRFTAAATFRMMPEGTTQVIRVPGSNYDTEDVQAFVARQQVYITDPVVVRDVLRSNDLQNPDGTGRKLQWLNDNIADPETALVKQISVAPQEKSALYRISMTGKNPKEIAAIVNAVARTYMDKIKLIESQQLSSEELRSIDARKNLEGEIQNLQQDLDNYRTVNNIPGAIESQTVLQATLAQLNSLVVTAEVRTMEARQVYENIKAQAAKNTLQLSPEMEQQMQMDPTLKQLESNKYELERARAVSVDKYGPQHRNTRDLDIEIVESQKQADALRDQLQKEYRQRMMDMALNALTSDTAEEQNLRARRDDQRRKIDDLDRAISEFKNRQMVIDSKQQLLTQLNQKIMATQINRGSDAARVQLVQQATEPTRSQVTYPKLQMFVPGGFVMGTLLAFGLAYLLELTNTRVRSPSDLTRTMQIPMLGFVPDQQDDGVVNGDLKTSIRTSPASMIAESFRQIRGRVSNAQHNGEPLHTLLVASMSPGGGATTVASNLANGMALNDRRVLLVDANFYRPGLRSVYPNIPNVGLRDVLAGRVELKSAIVQSTELPNLYLLGTGVVTSYHAESMESRSFREIFNQLKSQFDLVIFDGAPLNLVSDSLTLASKVDGVVGVVRAGAISRGTVGRIRDQLRQVNARLLGLVLNAAQTHGSGYFKQNYRSFYEYASASGAPAKTKGTH